jgi:hypothetical protein
MTTLKQRFVTFMRGTSGRLARIGFGAVLLLTGLLLGGVAGTALAIFSAMPIASGVSGVCPLGPLFGVDFRGRERVCGRPHAPGSRGA